MKNNIQNNTIIIALIAVNLVVGAFAIWNWKEVKEKELKINAVSECAKVAATADPDGGFNGAVYKVCVEDKGYESEIK